MGRRWVAEPADLAEDRFVTGLRRGRVAEAFELMQADPLRCAGVLDGEAVDKRRGGRVAAKDQLGANIKQLADDGGDQRLDPLCLQGAGNGPAAR